MKNRMWKSLRAALVVLACLAMVTPVWARRGYSPAPKVKLVKTVYECWILGVDSYGCLTDCGGQCAPLCALLNCRTGALNGTAKACVTNSSCRTQCYYNVDMVIPCEVEVYCSRDIVQKYGQVCYTVSGCYKENNNPA